MYPPKGKLPRLVWVGSAPGNSWGLSIVTRELMKRLDGFEKIIVCPDPAPRESIRTPSYTVYSAWKDDGIIHHVRNLDPDIIVLYHPTQWLNRYVDAKGRSDWVDMIPTIAYVTVEMEPVFDYFFDKLWQLQPDKVISPSKWSADIFKKEGFETDHLYHGVDERLFHPMPHVRQEREGFIYGTVARNDRRKNIPYAIKALSKMRDRENVSLNLVCSAQDVKMGDNLEIIGKLYDIRDRIDFYEYNTFGATLDTAYMAAVFNYFDVHLLPTGGESFGLPFLEAMACGIPNIAMDLPVLREIYGDAIEYVPSVYNRITEMGELPIPDVDILVEKMELLRTDEGHRNALVEKGIETSKKYTWEDAVSKLKRLLHETLEA